MKNYQREMEASALAAFMMEIDLHPETDNRPDPEKFISEDFRHIARIMAEGGTYFDVLNETGGTKYAVASLEVLKVEPSHIYPVSVLDSTIFKYLEEIKQRKETRTAAIEALQAIKERDGIKAQAVLREFVERERPSSQTLQTGNAIQAARDYLERLLDILEGKTLDSRIEVDLDVFAEYINKGLSGGIQAGQIGTIAARPGRGKSSFSFHVLDRAMRINSKIKACIFSLEMPAPDVAKKFIDYGMKLRGAKNLEPNMDDLRKGVIEAQPVLERLLIDDTTPLTADELISRAREYSKQGINLFLVDYIQLVNVDGYGAEHLRVAYGEAVRKLTEDAKNNGRAWIILSQFGRTADGRRPAMSDLKETSAIEENSHWIIGLHRPEEQDAVHNFEAHILKNRYGPAGEMLRMRADWGHCFFTDWRM